MSELRSAVETLRAEVLPELPDARIEDDFAELQRVCELLELERLRRLAEIERRQLFARDGHLSAASWLASRFGVAHGLRGCTRRWPGRSSRCPARCSALEAGDVSMSAAQVLVAARDVDPEAFERSEAALVEAARLHTVADLARVTALWRERVEREREVDGDDPSRARRRLHASRTFDGMVRLDGDLDPECGETLLTALGAVVDAGAARTARIGARRRSVEPTRSVRSVADGWTSRTVPPSRPSDRM